MSEKDDDHRRKELAAEERHSRELAKKSQASAEEMAQPPSGNGIDQGGDERSLPGATRQASSKVRKNLILLVVHLYKLLILCRGDACGENKLAAEDA